MTIPIPRNPGQQRRINSVVWYGGTTLLAILIAIVMINSVEDPTICSGTGLQITRTTVPNPLDLLTKPMPTPGVPQSEPVEETCP
jgi:hypothetical protein